MFSSRFFCNALLFLFACLHMKEINWFGLCLLGFLELAEEVRDSSVRGMLLPLRDWDILERRPRGE